MGKGKNKVKVCHSARKGINLTKSNEVVKYPDNFRRFGITELSESPGKKLDILILHGLDGHPVDSFTHNESDFFWPDQLAKDYPTARVMLYGYNADLESTWEKNLLDLPAIALKMLDALTLKRETNAIGRPLILFGHSLGGLVIKQAIVRASRAGELSSDSIILRSETGYRDIYFSTKTIIFCATPHQGTPLEQRKIIQAWKLVNNLQKKDVPKKLREVVREDSTILYNLYEIYRGLQICLKREVQTISLWEERETFGVGMPVVNKYTASAGVPGEIVRPLEGTHKRMIKFKSTNMEEYEQLVRYFRVDYRASHSEIPNVDLLAVTNVTRFNLSEPVSYFIGREKVLDDLAEILLPSLLQKGYEISQSHETQRSWRSPQIYVINGVSGTGKSQTALEFCKRHDQSFDGIFWIDVSAPHTLERDFMKLGEEYPWFDGDVRGVKKQLSRDPRSWLLILDDLNVNLDNLLDGLLERGPLGWKHKILVTSQERRSSEPSLSSSLESLLEAEAVHLLLCVSESNDADAEIHAQRIVQKLDCLPLAVVLAGAFIRNVPGLLTYDTKLSKELNGILTVNLENFCKNRLGKSYTKSIHAAWQITISRIETQVGEEEARDALCLFNTVAFYDRSGTFQDIFDRAWENLSLQSESQQTKSPCAAMIASTESKARKRRTMSAFTLLTDYCLLNRNFDAVGRGHYIMSRLVHTWARDRIQVTERKKYWRMAVSALALSISEEHGTSDYDFRRLATPHIVSCVKISAEDDGGDLKIVDQGYLDETSAASRFALALHENSSFDLAVKLAENAYRGSKTLSGPEDMNSLVLKKNLANYIASQGHVKKAKSMLEQVVREMSELCRGNPNDSRILSAKNGLANRLSDLGQLNESVRQTIEVYEGRMEALNPNQRDILVTMNNLAIRYHDLGDYAAALDWANITLDARISNGFPDDHPDNLKTKHTKVLILDELDDDEAIKIAKEVSAAREKRLGKSHPDTLASQALLASCHAKLGELDPANDLAFEVVTRAKEALDSRHRVLFEVRDILARIKGKRNKAQDLDEAITIMDEVIRLAKTGPTTKQQLLCYKFDLAILHCRRFQRHLATFPDEQGPEKLRKARKLFEPALEGLREVALLRKEALGPNHIETINTRYNLAGFTEMAGEVSGLPAKEIASLRDEAIDMMREVLKVRETMLGNNHKLTDDAKRMLHRFERNKTSAVSGDNFAAFGGVLLLGAAAVAISLRSMSS